MMYNAQGKISQADVLAKYAPLVRRLGLQLVAKMPASVDLDDLIQAGMIGLLDAASRYKEDQGAQFETYASQRIRGAMLDELRSNDWLPRSLRRTSREVETAVHKVEQHLGRSASETEIAETAAGFQTYGLQDKPQSVRPQAKSRATARRKSGGAKKRRAGR